MNDIPTSKVSEPFTKMAERIEHNANEAFGGAFVIVPPEGAGVVMQGLMLSSADPVQFWMMLQSQTTKALEELKTPSPYGRR